MGVNMERPNIEQMITFIYVSDLNDSKRFYEEIMGFPLRLDQGTCRIVETNQKGGGLLGYCARDQKSAPCGNLIITLVTSSVDEWYDYLTGCGVNIPEPPKLNLNYKIYHFFFTDPDGYKLEIQEFRDPAW
jgi:catechol 2,3-dioxygenase-like lactoylglutathione lyase family enzyme